MQTFKKILADALREVKLYDEFEDKIDLFAQHYDLLVRWNKIHNLTRNVDENRAVYYHYIDSILGLEAIRNFYDCHSGLGPESSEVASGLDSRKLHPHPGPLPKELLDIGSGAGFPGMVAAIVWPETKVTLLDASRKRCSFLRVAAAQIGLKNVTVIHERAGKGVTSSLVISRATFSKEFLSNFVNCLEPNGKLAIWVGESQDTDYSAVLLEAGIKLDQIESYVWKGVRARSVVVGHLSR